MGGAARRAGEEREGERKGRGGEERRRTITFCAISVGRTLCSAVWPFASAASTLAPLLMSSCQAESAGKEKSEEGGDRGGMACVPQPRPNWRRSAQAAHLCNLVFAAEGCKVERRRARFGRRVDVCVGQQKAARAVVRYRTVKGGW